MDPPSFDAVPVITTGVELLDQTIAKVATPNLAIGRCAKRINPAGTRALVEIVSTVMRGGPQLMA